MGTEKWGCCWDEPDRVAALFHDWDVEEFGDLGQKSCSTLEEECSGLFW